MIRLENGGKYYTTKTIKTLAIHQVNLDVSVGEFLAVMGPSGSGKSTLLNVIGMFENLDDGQLIVAGENVRELGYEQKIDLRRRYIGYIFQAFNLIPTMTVFDNVSLPLKYRGVAKPERQRRVEEVLAIFGMTHRSGHFPAQLSGGQQQRVAIARAVVARPRLILADEPTGNLDSNNSRDVLEQLKKINVEGTTVVMVTHSQEASAYADRVIRMRDGYLDG